jgi:hypothetical protein
MFAPKPNESTLAQRADGRRVLWLLLLYALVLPPLIWLRAHRHVSDPVLLAMAILASAPVLGVFGSWGRYLSQERDEYQQALALRPIAIATHVTMGAAIFWGFLQAFGVLPLAEAYWVPFLWIVVQGAFGCVSGFNVRVREG